MPTGMMSVSSLAQQPLTLLAVAPNRDILDLLKAILAADSNRILLTDNQDDGFRLAKTERPDVILATSGVHAIGPALCLQIRQDAMLAETPFIILTTSSNRNTFVDYFAVGCDQILPVPFKCSDIYAAISSARRRNQDNRQAKIHVLLKSGSVDFFAPTDLDRLLAAQKVLCFRRNDGVAVVDRDPLRCDSRAGYPGPERRVGAA